MQRAQNFVEKTFEGGSQTVKFVRFFSLEIFTLCSTYYAAALHVPDHTVISDESIVLWEAIEKSIMLFAFLKGNHCSLFLPTESSSGGKGG